MKKLLCALLAATLLLLLPACAGKTEPSADAVPPKSASADAPSAPSEPSTLPTPSGDGWETVDPEEPFGKYRSVDELLAILQTGIDPDNAQMPRAREREPVALEVQADGDSGDASPSGGAYSGGTNTVTFTNEDWEEPTVEFITAMPMGEATGQEGDASPTAPTGTGETWGVPTYTADLPQPPGTLGSAGEEAGAFTATATLTDESQYADYLEAVKAAGFNQNIQEEDMAEYGFAMMFFSAAHADGRQLMLTLNDTLLLIEITK